MEENSEKIEVVSGEPFALWMNSCTLLRGTGTVAPQGGIPPEDVVLLSEWGTFLRNTCTQLNGLSSMEIACSEVEKKHEAGWSCMWRVDKQADLDKQ